ncbi:MAG TPA: PAS domain S-box protein [Acidobacteriota bacterium]|nr:PAS domain S-box protein [Acidobacteriota bacterium]
MPRDNSDKPKQVSARESEAANHSERVNELRRVVRTYSHLFLRPADALLIWDTDGVVRNANEAACILTGLGKDELLGKRCFDLFPRILRPVLTDILARAPGEKDGAILIEAETALLDTRTGSKGIPVLLRASSVHIDGIVSIFGITHDLRDLKDLEARLASSRARYQEIVENVNDVIIILDSKGILQFINSTGERALGRKREELDGLDLRLILHQEDTATLETILERGSLGGPAKQPTIRISTSSGEEREYAVSATPMPDESGTSSGILGILRDVTGRREIEERLQYAERMRSVGDILSKVTHEVKNPLAAIHASAEFLRRHWDSDDSKKQEVVHLIAEEATRLNKIIMQFLRIQRIPRPNMIEQEIEPVIANVVKSVKVLLSEKTGIKISTAIAAATFALDADLIKQIIWNLVNNSVDAIAGEEGDGRGSIEVTGSILDKKRMYKMVVRDNGCGMDPEMAARAFDPFFTTKSTGTGLGLPLVKMHVEAMGGEVFLNSRAGDGTSLTVLLPMNAEGV